MKVSKVKLFDAAEYLKDEEDIVYYLNEAMGTGNTSIIMSAFGDVARARSMIDVAKKAGLTKQGAYKALSGEGYPSFDTISKVAAALGLQLKIESQSKA
ncbi:putative addiction module antidote protein [Cobetia sp. SIMBA_158]|uniref:addiction module antidote protein n=1 Tax=Cobetia sp. SIMBA_158 TaxID=3081617 RepID=UPI003980F9F5